jgi:hypothetical protein
VEARMEIKLPNWWEDEGKPWRRTMIGLDGAPCLSVEDFNSVVDGHPAYFGFSDSVLAIKSKSGGSSDVTEVLVGVEINVVERLR